MEISIKALQFILSLSFLILIHEFGHFFFAKLFKTRVEKFYLFFNPWFTLFKFKKNDTEYGIGWLPLGGYVKISGMVDESLDKEQLKKDPEPYEFRSKPSWQRLLIMTGGVMVNFVAALFIFSMILYTWGDQFLPNENAKYGITVDSIAYNAGLRNGDKVISVDNKKVDYFHQIISEVVINRAKTITVKRDTSIIDINLPDNLISQLVENQNARLIGLRIPFYVGGFPADSEAQKSGLIEGDRLMAIDSVATPFYDLFKQEISKHKSDSINISYLRNGQLQSTNVFVNEQGLIGIMAGKLDTVFIYKNIEYGFFESIPAGISRGMETLSDYVKQMKLLFQPETKAYESMGGFISIGSIFPGVWDWQSFWALTALLSIILAFMNILPIPALDGGHVLFLLYEIITRRKPSEKFLINAQVFGMVLLFALMIYANLNDIFRFFF